jgi:hypothetical protein
MADIEQATIAIVARTPPIGICQSTADHSEAGASVTRAVPSRGSPSSQLQSLIRRSRELMKSKPDRSHDAVTKPTLR